MSPTTGVSQKWFRAAIKLAVCTALVVLPYAGYFAQNGQQIMQSRSEAGDLECVSYCSTTQLGAVIMEVRVRVADRQLNETDLRAKVQQQGLEVTVYADGFERGLFASVPAIKPKALFTLQPSPLARAKKIPGLEKLVITDVATRVDKTSQLFLLTQPPLATAAEGEWVTVRIEGAEPGLAYSYRIPGGRSIVTCQAVVCPVDTVPSPTIRPTP
jgi:hypothetical protein